jgi:hypothetical protein
VATTVETPDPDEQCAYCGSRIFDHDPVCVRDCTADCGSPSYFCNHGCLSAHVDESLLLHIQKVLTHSRQRRHQ